MELEEAGSSEQSMQQSQKKETGSDTPPSDGVCTDDYKELIVQMRKAHILFQQMSSIPLGELTIPVPPNKAGAESVEVTFTYDINSLLEVEVLVNSTGQKHRKVIQNGSRVLSEEEVQARLKELQYLKIPPREEEPNRLLLFRGEQLYQETHGAVRQEVDRLLTWFEQVLAQRDRRAIEKARRELSAALDRLEEME